MRLNCVELYRDASDGRKGREEFLLTAIAVDSHLASISLFYPFRPKSSEKAKGGINQRNNLNS